MNFQEIIRQQTVGRDLSALGGCSDTWMNLLKLIIGPLSYITLMDGEPKHI